MTTSWSAQSQTLEVEFGSDPALLTGRVQYPGDAHRKMLVGLSRMPAQDVFASIQYVETDPANNFQFRGLAPGEYRIFAIPTEKRADLSRPYSLESLVRSGASITLGPHGAQTITLDVSDPHP